MSVTETPVELQTPITWEPDLGDEPLHLECCRVTRFYCGRPYHPELAAPEGDIDEDEVCKQCLEVLLSHACWRGHQHCPIPLLGGFVCPDA